MIKNDKSSICPTCNHQSVEYTHSINKTLISCLRRLHNIGGLSRLDNMGLDNTQFANFQKLKYFNLVISTNKNNEWQITNDGTWFLQGRMQIHKSVTTRNARVIRRSTELVFIGDIKDGVEYKIGWQTQKSQLSLFD